MVSLAATQMKGRRLGRYVMYDEFAAGGMATVHFGRLLGPLGFSRVVAIKALHPHFAKEPALVEMFVREVQLAARVRHQHVLAPLDVVVRDGELFLVMEYIQGQSLSRMLTASHRARTLLPLRIVASIVMDALHGLHAAHEATSEQGEPLGLVHRDVSPSNLLIGLGGLTHVLDFGIAKATAYAPTTQNHNLKGKIAYMAPEQICGGRIDRRTDVYATGVVLWECLTGRRLFSADSPGAIAAQVLGGALHPPSHFRRDVPQELDRVVMRALSWHQEERYATAMDFAVALELVVTPASNLEVAEWVLRLAADDLRERAELVASIEACEFPLDTPSRPSIPPLASLLPNTDRAFSLTVGRTSLRFGIIALIAIALTLTYCSNRDPDPSSARQVSQADRQL